VRFLRGSREIEQEVVDQGVRLTAVGITTAFGVLLLLTLVIVLMGWAASFASRRFSKGAGSASDEHDKALAAVVAVSAMREKDDGPGVDVG
jgi:Na+-transporting methylmalonyl-CoA/oxaloacetate decarboxylase gamma subunit